MTRSPTATTDADPDAPTLTRGAKARRALILRRAANRTSRRILRSLGGKAARVAPPLLTGIDRPASDPVRAPLGRPVHPDEALDAERNRWGGRL
jgi:hypothetical protein